MKIRIAGLVSDSIVDGPGLRYAIFGQGCPRSCPGCHNPQTHDPNGGVEKDADAILKEISSNPLIEGVTFSGGEPFMQAREFAYIAREAHKLGLNVVVYTGYLWEELVGARNDAWNELLSEADVVVDGPFVQELRDWTLTFAGSSNQRFIDARRSLATNSIVQMKSFAHMPDSEGVPQ